MTLSVIFLALMCACMFNGVNYSNMADDARDDDTQFCFEDGEPVARDLDDSARFCAKWSLVWGALAVAAALWAVFA